MGAADASAGRTVLVVEDDAQVADMVAEMLARHGYAAVLARDGVEAVSRTIDGGVDLILLDIMMPFFSGYWYCDIFKKNPATRDIPVIIISALDRRSDIEKGLRLGAAAYLTKPFTEDTLIDAVRSVFEGGGTPSGAAGRRRKGTRGGR
ncbi:MAG: response regulator [bacterium]|nr:response regulator [bacterium]